MRLGACNVRRHVYRGIDGRAVINLCTLFPVNTWMSWCFMWPYMDNDRFRWSVDSTYNIKLKRSGIFLILSTQHERTKYHQMLCSIFTAMSYVRLVRQPRKSHGLPVANLILDSDSPLKRLPPFRMNFCEMNITKSRLWLGYADGPSAFASSPIESTLP